LIGQSLKVGLQTNLKYDIISVNINTLQAIKQYYYNFKKKYCNETAKLQTQFISTK